MKNKTLNKFLNSKLFYFGTFIISAVFILLPLIFLRDLKYHPNLGLIEIAIVNFVGSASFLPSPGFLSVALGGRIYNPILVALVSAISSTLGQGVGFVFGYSTKKITHNQHKMLNFLEKIFKHKYASIMIVLLAFIPNPFVDIIGLLAGVSSFSLKRFLLLVFLGRICRDILMAYAGHYLIPSI